MGTRNLHAGFHPVRRVRSVSEKPINKQADILMKNVPYGKRVPSRLAMVESTQNLAMEPIAPPSAM